MKVKDLILKLQALDQDAIMVTIDDNIMEMQGALVTATCVTQYDKAKKTTERFTDAFDDTTYNEDIWSFRGGEESIIIIQ